MPVTGVAPSSTTAIAAKLLGLIERPRRDEAGGTESQRRTLSRRRGTEVRPDRITPISNVPLPRPLQPTLQRRPLGR
jgi:hypothetical protein